MGIASLGLSSGIDFDGIITKVITAEGTPLRKLQEDKVADELKGATVLNLKTKLLAFESSVNTLNDPLQFNTKTASITTTSTGVELLTVTADETAVVGNAAITVNQLAMADKKSAQGFVDKDTTAVASATGSLKFKLGAAGSVTSVAVSSTMTLEQLRDEINAAKGGVTASIINDGTGTNSFRLILTADSTGSANNIVITNNDTTLDFTNKKIEDIFKYTTNSFSGSVISNSGNFYSGTENNTFLTKITTAGATGTAKYKLSTDGGITFGSEITTSTLSNTASQFVITTGVNDVIKFTENSTSLTATIAAGTYTATDLAAAVDSALESPAQGNFTVSYSDTTGKFTIQNDDNADNYTFNFSNSLSTASGILGFDTASDSSALSNGESVASDFVGGMFIDGTGIASATNGGVKMIFGTSGTLAVDDKFSVDGFNPEMQAAQDAVVKVDNATITKSSNTITDIIQGVTLNLIKADSSSTLTMSVARENSAVKGNIEDFVTAYNTVAEFFNEQLSFDPDGDAASPLLGDSTAQIIHQKLGNIVTGTIPGVSNKSFNSLSSIGISSNSKSGILSLDSAKLSSALTKDPDAVAKLFVGLATPSNAAVKFESKTAKTLPGTYSVSVSAAPEQATFSSVAKLSGGGDARNDLSTTGLTEAETLVVMFSKNHTDVSPDFTSLSVTLTAGSTINTIVNDLNSAFATKGAALSASNDSGKLEIKSTGYGKDIFLQVSTDKDGASGQILQDIDGTGNSETVKDNGVDIKGFINNHAAVGFGNQLTGGAGFVEEGLVISTKSSSTGGLGTVTVSSGVVDRLSTVLATFTNDADGLLKTKIDSIQKQVEDIKGRQETLEKRLVDKEEQLRAQFVRLESLISEFKATGDFLTSSLASLPEIGGG